jgi:hypothetical protein
VADVGLNQDNAERVFRALVAFGAPEVEPEARGLRRRVTDTEPARQRVRQGAKDLADVEWLSRTAGMMTTLAEDPHEISGYLPLRCFYPACVGDALRTLVLQVAHSTSADSIV